MGHTSTHITEAVYRNVIEPGIRGRAPITGDVFSDDKARYWWSWWPLLLR